jgi:hypothetical protein
MCAGTLSLDPVALHKRNWTTCANNPALMASPLAQTANEAPLPSAYTLGSGFAPEPCQGGQHEQPH